MGNCAKSTPARDKLILQNIGIVRTISLGIWNAFPYVRQVFGSPDDVVSAGTVGCIEAIDGFKPELGELRTRIQYLVTKAIINELRKSQSVTVPRSLLKKLWAGKKEWSSVPQQVDMKCIMDPPDKHSTIEDIDNADEARAALAKLTPKQAEAVSLRYGFDGKGERKSGEIAKAMNLKNAKAASNVLQWARKVMRKPTSSAPQPSP